MPTLDSDRVLDEAEIWELAIIYKKESLMKLTDYQKQIHEVAQGICIKKSYHAS